MVHRLALSGVDIDFVGPEDGLEGYALIVLPQSMIVTPDLAARLEVSGAKLLIGARSGSMTPQMQTPSNLAPGALADLTGVRVVRVESLPDIARESVQLQNGQLFGFGGWREIVETEANVWRASKVPIATPAQRSSGRIVRHIWQWYPAVRSCTRLCAMSWNGQG